MMKKLVIVVVAIIFATGSVAAQNRPVQRPAWPDPCCGGPCCAKIPPRR